MRAVCKSAESEMRTRLQEDIKKHYQAILEGTLLAIDPASGGSSLPGFCYFKQGQFIESGVIRLPQSALIETRLQQLSKTLREQFEVPDVLVIEDIPPFMANKGGGFRTRSVVNLHYSVGVILASVNTSRIIRCTPVAWRHWVSQHWPDYVKTDENDAVAMARCILHYAKEELREYTESLSGDAKKRPRVRPKRNRS